MVKKNNNKIYCQPGYICLENIVFFGLLLFLFVVIYFMFKNNNFKDDSKNNKLFYGLINNKSTSCNCGNNKTSTSCNCCNNNNNNNNNNSDILLNPYTPPLKNDIIFNGYTNGIPVNVKTQSVNLAYNQIGILTRVNGDETILPLMGRQLYTNRDKWNYYTMNDKNNMIKLPVLFKNKRCTSEQGCDCLYEGDTVYVQGYKELFRVTLYDNNSLEYIPYL
tara:strand:- start:61 stop:720 length:660 start_codon:yes stop_codon:yes gene_type:complete